MGVPSCGASGGFYVGLKGSGNFRRCGGLYLVGNSIKVAVLALMSCVRRGVLCFK